MYYVHFCSTCIRVYTLHALVAIFQTSFSLLFPAGVVVLSGTATMRQCLKRAWWRLLRLAPGSVELDCSRLSCGWAAERCDVRTRRPRQQSPEWDSGAAKHCSAQRSHRVNASWFILQQNVDRPTMDVFAPLSVLFVAGEWRWLVFDDTEQLLIAALHLLLLILLPSVAYYHASACAVFLIALRLLSDIRVWTPQFEDYWVDSVLSY